MMPMMGMPGPVSEKRRYAGVDLENLKCGVCEVKFTSKSQIDVHIQLPAHLEKAKDLPVEEECEGEQKEPEPFVPLPLHPQIFSQEIRVVLNIISLCFSNFYIYH